MVKVCTEQGGLFLPCLSAVVHIQFQAELSRRVLQWLPVMVIIALAPKFLDALNNHFVRLFNYFHGNAKPANADNSVPAERLVRNEIVQSVAARVAECDYF